MQNYKYICKYKSIYLEWERNNILHLEKMIKSHKYHKNPKS